MSPLVLRAGGTLLGVLLGLVGARLADVLPARYGITHLTSGKRRARRNAAVVFLTTACGAGLAEILVSAPPLAALHVVFLLVVNLAVAMFVIAAAAIDLEHMILPDELTLGGAVLCALSSPLRHVGLVQSLVGALVGVAAAWLPTFLYRKLRGHGGMGFGDAKLAALAGAWHGPVSAVLVLFGAAMLMPLVAGAMRLAGASYDVPESVKAEIGELKKRADEGDDAARAELEDDPMAAEIDDGPLSARLPLGPFLALTTLVLLFARRPVERAVLDWLAR